MAKGTLIILLTIIAHFKLDLHYLILVFKQLTCDNGYFSSEDEEAEAQRPSVFCQGYMPRAQDHWNLNLNSRLKVRLASYLLPPNNTLIHLG